MIRRALEKDCPRLAELSTELGYPMSAEEASRRLREIAGHPDHALLVAEARTGIAGWIQASVPRIFEASLQAEIAGLVVGGEFRGRGIGAALLAAAESWAREKGCRVIRVRSNVVRGRAHDFYRREGYGEIKTQRVFEKHL